MHSFKGQLLPKTILIYVLTLACISLASAQPNPQQEAERDQRPDNIGTGPYPAMKEVEVSLPAHVVFRPQNLSTLGNEKLGLIVWGNGGCTDDAASSRFHLLELASHGYLVIASGQVYSGPGAILRVEQPPAAQGQVPPPRTTPAQLTRAIDWALHENARKDSPYYGRIDGDQIVVSGFSCGGIQALSVAGDPRIDTLVLQNTGIFNDSPAAPMAGMDLTKDDLKSIHTPTIYILGGETDIAYANGMDDYQRINHVPIAVANLPVGHGGTYNEDNGGQAAQVAVNWLKWQLRSDQKAASWFVGQNCVLCSDDEWTLETKNLE
jgi:hypothetical protein